jgi:hypothetical protein
MKKHLLPKMDNDRKSMKYLCSKRPEASLCLASIGTAKRFTDTGMFKSKYFPLLKTLTDPKKFNEIFWANIMNA